MTKTSSRKPVGEEKDAVVGRGHRPRWPGNVFPVVLALATLIFLVSDLAVRRHMLQQISAVETMEFGLVADNLPGNSRPRTYIPPPTDLDGRWWIEHAETMLQQGNLRIRHTERDNAPQGREVHWNSAIPWMLAGLAVISGEGDTLASRVPSASFWFATLTLVLSLLLLGWPAVANYGWRPTVLFLSSFCLLPLIYAAFRAGQVDHHGLVATFSTACVLFLIMGGAGIVHRKPAAASLRQFLPSQRAARRFFVFSGVCGGAALWISAATMIPVLVGIAGGAILAVLLRDRENGEPAPRLWWLWGVAGCITSLALYLLEYFPNHLGMRIEVNHPVYAFAWLGAGYVLSVAVSVITGSVPFRRGWGDGALLFVAVSAAALPLFLMVRFSDSMFWVSDRFMLMLHNEYIQEFASLPRILRNEFEWMILWEFFFVPFVVLAGAALVIGTKRAPRATRSVFAIMVAPAAIVLCLACWQVRWSLSALSLWTLGFLVLAVAYGVGNGKRSRLFEVASVAVFAALFFPLPIVSVFSFFDLQTLSRNLPKAAVPPILIRDISQRLLQSSPNQLPRVLAAPTTSTDLVYFSGIETIGTLYWENTPGLKRAARIFAAESEEDAKQQLMDAGITHILVASWDDFGQAYVRLLRESGEMEVAEEKAFLNMLLAGDIEPEWLRPLYYPIPEGFGIDETIRLYAFLPNQTPGEAKYFQGVYALDSNDPQRALTIFKELLEANPGNPDLIRMVSAARRKLSLVKPPVENPSTGLPHSNE